MKRLERLGTVAFTTILFSLIFHLLAMSFNHWKENNCRGCTDRNALSSWYTSMNQRCYQASMASIFFPSNSSKFNASSNAFVTEICIPNQYLMAKSKEYAVECFYTAQNQADTVCVLGDYDNNHCKCDYTSSTKTVIAMTVLAALALGIMMFLSHLISFVKIDYILKWLIPVCFTLLTFAIICMLIALIVTGSALHEDVDELRYYRSLIGAAFGDNVTTLEYWTNQLESEASVKYKVNVGWCFGLEILALHFSVVSLIVYAIIFLVKKRPESRK